MSKDFRTTCWILPLALAASILWPGPGVASQDGRDEPAPDAERPPGGRVVLSASELKRNPDAPGTPVEQVSAEPMDPAKILPGLRRQASHCQVPALTLEALDPASRRAVIRIASEPPRVVKPGTVLPKVEIVVRSVREDMLVAEGPAGDDGKRPTLWIHLPEEAGSKSRVQCLVPGVAP